MSLALDVARAVNCCPAPDLFGEVPDPPCGVCQQCERLARGLHADLRIITVGDQDQDGEDRGRTQIGIDQVRKSQAEAVLKPFEGKRRVFIVDGAEYMTSAASNCLLKTLEEPPDQVVFILLATSLSLLPDTIVSRCQVIELRPVPSELLEPALIERYKLSLEEAVVLARRAHGIPGLAIAMNSDQTYADRRSQALFRIVGVITGGLEARFRYARDLAAQFWRDRAAVYDELEQWSDWWRDVLLTYNGLSHATTNPEWAGVLESVAESLGQDGLIQAAGSVASTRKALTANASPRLALEVFVLDMPRASSSIMGLISATDQISSTAAAGVKEV